MSPHDGLLIGSAALMGLAGSVHCAAMCGPLCAGVQQRSPGRGMPLLLAGRILSYAVAGAVVSLSVGWLSGPAALASSPLRLAWAAAHAAVLALGLWLLVQGRQPAWLEALGRGSGSPRGLSPGVQGPDQTPEQPVRWQPPRGSQSGAASISGLAGLSGLAWALLPCGLLHSALLVAALGSHSAVGALSMTAFAVASTPALVAGPVALRLLARLRPAWGEPQRIVRVSGLLCILASSWALGHGLWRQAIGYC